MPASLASSACVSLRAFRCARRSAPLEMCARYRRHSFFRPYQNLPIPRHRDKPRSLLSVDRLICQRRAQPALTSDRARAMIAPCPSGRNFFGSETAGRTTCAAREKVGDATAPLASNHPSDGDIVRLLFPNLTPDHVARVSRDAHSAAVPPSRNSVAERDLVPKPKKRFFRD